MLRECTDPVQFHRRKILLTVSWATSPRLKRRTEGLWWHCQSHGQNQPTNRSTQDSELEERQMVCTSRPGPTLQQGELAVDWQALLILLPIITVSAEWFRSVNVSFHAAHDHHLRSEAEGRARVTDLTVTEELCTAVQGHWTRATAAIEDV